MKPVLLFCFVFLIQFNDSESCGTYTTRIAITVHLLDFYRTVSAFFTGGTQGVCPDLGPTCTGYILGVRRST